MKTIVKKLEQMTKKQGRQAAKRLFNNTKDVGINVYNSKHSNGVFWQYENTSNDYVLAETVKFNIKNSWIEGHNGDEVTIVVKPKDSQLISIIYGKGNNDGAGAVVDYSYHISKE